jgi:hypothetical protein
MREDNRFPIFYAYALLKNLFVPIDKYMIQYINDAFQNILKTYPWKFHKERNNKRFE